MSKQDEYLDSAAHAVELAARISSSDEKSHLLELAERWRDLADRCRHQATPPLKEHRLRDRLGSPAYRGRHWRAYKVRDKQGWGDEGSSVAHLERVAEGRGAGPGDKTPPATSSQWPDLPMR
jgi:hypothetical protein